MSDHNCRSHGESSEECEPDFSPAVGDADRDVLAELTRLAGGGASLDHLPQLEPCKDNKAQCSSTEGPSAQASLEKPTAELILDLDLQSEARAADSVSEAAEGAGGQPAPARPDATPYLVFQPTAQTTLVAPEPAHRRRKGFAVAAALVGILGGILGGGASFINRGTSSTGSDGPPRAELDPAQVQAVPSDREAAIADQRTLVSDQSPSVPTPIEGTSTPARVAAGLSEPEASDSRTEPAGLGAQPAAIFKALDATPVQAQAVPSEGGTVVADPSSPEVPLKLVRTTPLVSEGHGEPEPGASPAPAPKLAPQPADMFAQSLDAHAEVAPFQRDTMVTAPAQMGAGAADSPWSVQLVSEKSEGQARAAFEHIRKEHQAILAGLQPQITKVELGAKGTYYRVRIGAKTQEAANKLCSALKAAGSSCWIQRN